MAGKEVRGSERQQNRDEKDKIYFSKYFAKGELDDHRVERHERRKEVDDNDNRR